MIRKGYLKFFILILCGQLFSIANASDMVNQHQFEIKTRGVHFNRRYEGGDKNREFTGFGVIADYRSPKVKNILQLGLSAYLSKNTAAHGYLVEDVFAFEDGKIKDTAFLGEAYLLFMPVENVEFIFGRQKHKSLLLKSSTSRSLPSTFQGISVSYNVSPNVDLYAAVYDKWSRRASDDFTGFATDQSEEGAIDYVALVGGSYETDNFSIEAEYFQSKDYMQKWGFEASYLPEIDEAIGRMKLSVGLYTSSDAGNLFVAGAESGELDDEDQSGLEDGVTRINHSGVGGYVQAQLTRGNTSYAIAFTQIEDAWLEDSFTGDHGLTPFPTTSMGPDLSNSGEFIWGFKFKYDWQKYLSGLNTTFRYGRGKGAENTVSKDLGMADEKWWEVDVKYKLPFLKGLKFRSRYRDYDSDEIGSVDGVKGDRSELRVYLDYTYQFE